MRLISGLTASTEYSIEVAAVNSAGTGVYSNAIMQLTQGIISYTILNDLHLIRSFQSFPFSSSSSLVSSWVNNGHRHLPLLDQCWLSGGQL